MSFQPPAELSANSWYFEMTNGISPIKVIFTSTFSILLLSLLPRLCFFNVSAAVVQVLNQKSPVGGWVLFRIVNTAMFTSREKKTAWIFRC